MLKQWLRGCLLLLVLTVVTGGVYPLAVTGVAQLLFPWQAGGSLIVKNGQVIGSALLGQNFSEDRYFEGRPSAAGDDGYDATASSGTNLGPTSDKLMTALQKKVQDIREKNQLSNDVLLPVDLVTSSASGLDPDISLPSAYLQVQRIAGVRHISESEVYAVIQRNTQGREWGFLGEKRVNVLQLNRALDDL